MIEIEILKMIFISNKRQWEFDFCDFEFSRIIEFQI